MTDDERREEAADTPVPGSRPAAPEPTPAHDVVGDTSSDGAAPIVPVAAAETTAAEPPEPGPLPEPPPPPVRPGFFAEPPEVTVDVPRSRLTAQSRRDFLLFAAGVFAAGTGAWLVLPQRAKSRLLPGAVNDRLDTLAARVGLTRERREKLMDRSLTFDDDVAEALYSKDRRVRSYDTSQAEPLRNNYHGRTPGPEFLQGWALELGGLASGERVRLTREQLLRRFALHGQVTRLVCVEGWSAIAWWGGLCFKDLLAAFPPAPGARWAAMRSEVGLDNAGRPEPYFVSLDLETARHPQSLLATHHGGRPLTLAHGAPLRLVAPVKLGLKNIKAITHIEYVAEEPPDYWNQRGYSKYDGL